MITRRIRQIIQCAKMQINAGNLLRARAYYIEAGKLITQERMANARATREIMETLTTGYAAASQN